MFEAFRQYITVDKGCQLTDAELERFRSAAMCRQLRKRQFLLQAGEINVMSTFIVKGCMRMYRVDEQGNEHILNFGTENWWMMDKESYLNNQPSKYYIDAIEDCQLLIWPRDTFRELLLQIPAMKNYMAELVAQNNIHMQTRLYETISYSAEEKYHNFIKTYPDLYNRVPLHMIASYLGVSRETLSRVRNQFAYK